MLSAQSAQRSQPLLILRACLSCPGVPSTPRGTGDSRRSCVTPELCTIAISASHRGTCPQERRESRESATPSSSQFGRKLSSQPRFSSPHSSSTPPRLRQTAPAAIPCLGSARLPQQPPHAAREISYAQSQTHSLASLNPSSRGLQNRPHGRTAQPPRAWDPPRTRDAPRQQRLLPGSRGGSGFFTTFERQTLEAAPGDKAAHRGVCRGTAPTRQTQTLASCLRRTETGLQTQRAPATPPQSPNTSFSSNKRAGGLHPIRSAAQRAECPPHRLTPRAGKAGGRGEGRKTLEKTGGAGAAHVPSPTRVLRHH